MTVDAASFRMHYPEFDSTTVYPDAMITYWISVAVIFLNKPRFGTAYDFGIENFVAHNLSLEAMAQKTAATGGVPGGNVGVANSKSVDKVSIGYDTSAGLDPKATHWNLTIYGQRFWRLVKMFGAGPIQVNGCNWGGGPYGGPAWFGPWQYNVANPQQ